MAASNLDVKISTLVEGLQQVRELSTGLNNLALAAANASDISGKAGGKLGQLGAGALGSQEAMASLRASILSLQGSFSGFSSNSNALASALAQIRASNDQLSASLSGLGAQVDNLGERFSSVPGPARSAGASISKAMAPADQSVGLLIARVKQLAVAFIALAGVMGLKAAADLAARTETLGITLEQVAGNAGYSADEIKRYTNELKALGITTGAARSSLTQLIQAGINLSEVNEAGASKAAQLARASQDLAVVTGENSSDTLSRLILNIRQMDTEGLRYLGLNVDIAASQELFAASIGKTAGALTTQQKQQAVMNAALLEAEKLAGSYEASLASVGKQLGSMSRYQEEAGNAIGNNLLPAYGMLVASATELLKTVQQVADQVATTSFPDTLKSGIGEMSQSFTTLLQSLVSLSGSLATSFGGIVDSAGNLVALISDMITGLVVFGDESNVLLYILNTAGFLIAGLADGVKFLYGGFLVLSGYAGKFLAVLVTGLGQVVSLVSDDLGDAFKNIAEDIKGMSDESLKSAGKIADDFANGKTAVQDFYNTVTGLKSALKEVGAATNYDGVIEDIRVLTAAQRDSKITSDEAAEAAARITANIKAMGDAHELTEKQVAALNSKVATTMADTQKKYSEALAGLGFSLKKLGSDDQVLVPINRQLQEANGFISTLAANTLTTKAQFDKAFSSGLDTAKTVDDISTLAFNLKEAEKNALDTGLAVKLAGVRFEEVFKSDLGAAKTVEDLLLIKQTAEVMGAQQILSAEKVKLYIEQVDRQIAVLQDRLANSGLVAPIEAAGIAFNELTTGVSAAGTSAAASMKALVAELMSTKNAASMTSAEILKVFNGNLGQAKTLGDLAAISAEMRNAKGSGEEYKTLMASVATETSAKFNELFQAQLKSANTKVEFDALRDAVRAVGASGSISGTQMKLALEQIDEAATKAREGMMTLATQATELAQQRVSLAGADNEVLSSGLRLEREKNTLTKLVNDSKKAGSKVTEEEINLQKAVIREAQALQALAKARYNLEKAELDALIAKQKELNAQKKLSVNPTDEKLMAAADAAAKEAEAKELVAEKARTIVAEQEKVVKETEKAKIRAEELAKALKDGAAGAKDIGSGVAGVGAATSMVGKTVASFNVESVAKQLMNAGFAAKEASSVAAGLLGGYNTIAAFGSEGIAAYRRVEKGIRDAVEAKKRLGEEAQETTERFSDTAAEAQAIADGLVTAGEASSLFGKKTNALAEAMASVKLQAHQTIKGSVDAVSSFLSSSQSLQLELLSAQGREDEVAAARFEQRRKELDVEHAMLKAKIQGAIVTAQAAGVSTSSLRASLAEADSAYSKSISALRELENIDRRKRSEDAEARAKADAEKAASVEAEIDGIEKVAAARQEALKPVVEGPQGVSTTTGQSQLRTLNEEQMRAFKRLSGAQQSLAPVTAAVDDALGSAKSPANSAQLIAKESASRVTKVVELKFIDEKGQTATATVPEEQSQRLIDILDEFRRRT